MIKDNNKIFWGIVLLAIFIAGNGIYKAILIKKNPVYIFAKITSVSIASKTLLGYEFIYEKKVYSGSINTSGVNYKIGDLFMVQFQKYSPSNNRPIFDKDNWRCLLNDSSYYYGSPKKPDCAY